MREDILRHYLQGTAADAYRQMGAHLGVQDGQLGCQFTVYAPAARQVAVIGDFNGWQGQGMARQTGGLWTCFIPGVAEGDLYKFRVTTQRGDAYDRIDPFAFSSELRPNTASRVCDLSGFAWSDGAWMARRNKGYGQPLSIYEVHAGSWRRKDGDFLSYEELAETLIPYVQSMGYTHIELMPLGEYPFDGSWGYQTTGYFAATSRYGAPQGLMRLVDACHAAGLGVLLDVVPVHFVTDFYALHQYDGSYLYESPYEGLRYSPWGTALFDYTKPPVLSFMKSCLDFWLEIYHFDGLRYDAVSNLLYQDGDPAKGDNEPGRWFLREVNYALQARHPSALLMAEDSSMAIKVTAPVVYGGRGFDYKWDLGWMHDTLDYLALPPAERAGRRELFLQSINYFYQDIFLMPFSHDEVVHGKKTIIDKLYGDYEEKFCQLRALYLYMMTHPGKKLNFMGNDLAEFKEWDEQAELGWNLLTYPAHEAFHRYFARLHHVYRQLPALFAADYDSRGFEWLDAGQMRSTVFAYVRRDLEGHAAYVALNLGAEGLKAYPLPVTRPGAYVVALSTDEATYGGNTQAFPALEAQPGGGGYVLRLTLPPLSGCLIVPQEAKGPGK